jgi:hypothetical protein
MTSVNSRASNTAIAIKDIETRLHKMPRIPLTNYTHRIDRSALQSWDNSRTKLLLVEDNSKLSRNSQTGAKIDRSICFMTASVNQQVTDTFERVEKLNALKREKDRLIAEQNSQQILQDT